MDLRIVSKVKRIRLDLKNIADFDLLVIRLVALTSTAIGNLYLQDVAFSVTTNVLGLQGLNARPASVSNLDVYHGYSAYLQINGQ